MQLPATGEKKEKGIKETGAIGELEITGKTEKVKAQSLPEKPLLSVSVYSSEGLEKALEGGADCVYLGEGLFRKPKVEEKEKDSSEKGVFSRKLGFILENSILKTRVAGKKIYFNTPKIVKDSEMKQVEETLSSVQKFGADGVLVSNLGTFNLAKEKGIPCIADSPLNIYNGYTLSLLLQNGAKVVVASPELTLEELKEVASCGPVECIVHGRLELMESEHCLAGGLLDKNGEQCSAPCSSGNFKLVDEKSYEFPLLMDYQCRTHLLNSRSLCMLENIPTLIESGVSSLRIETLGMDSVEEIRKVVEKYRKAVDSFYEPGEKATEKCESLGKGFTTGTISEAYSKKSWQVKKKWKKL